MATTPGSAVTEAERRRIIVGVLLAMLLAALDQTIVGPAMPTIGAELGDVAYLPWIVSAYLLTATATTPLYGKLADIHGRRPVLLGAIGLFVLGSIACGLAPTMLALVLGRGLQGLGGGGLVALAQTVIGDLVPPRERARYTVHISAMWATASVAGPVAGGLFAEHLHWSLIFWINIPLAAVAVAMTGGRLRRLPFRLRPHRLDLAGSLLIVAATVALMLALTWGGSRHPWTSPTVVGLLALSLAAWAAFGLHLGRAREPLIPLAVLRDPVVASATGCMFFGTAVFVGLSTFVPLYLELAFGLGAGQAGVALLPLVAGSVVGASASGRLTARVSRYKRPAVLGCVAAGGGLALLAFLGETATLAETEILLAVVGGGVGTLFPVTNVSVQNAADSHDLGVATASLAFARSLGAAVGVAALGAIILAGGVAHDLGEVPRLTAEAAINPARAGDAGRTFRLVFAAALACLTLSLICLLAMEERPLRGRVVPPEGGGAQG